MGARGPVGPTDEQVLALKNEGLTVREIADCLGVAVSTVDNHLKNHRGEYANQPKGRKVDITEEEKSRIRFLKKSGYSLRDIERMMDFSRTIITKILKEETI